MTKQNESLDPTEVVNVAILARLKADAGLAALVAGRIYVRPPASLAYPHVLLEAPTLGAFDTLGRYGKAYTVQLRALSQQRGTEEAIRIRSRLVALTDGHRAGLADPFRVFWLELEPSPAVYATSEAGVVTTHAVAILKVWVR